MQDDRSPVASPSMETLFDGDVHVHYGQFYVESGWQIPEDGFTRAFAGQVNGLCGGAAPGFLCMVTGLHTGHVEFTLELHDEAPPVDDFWEDVVEVSFRATSETVALVQWGAEAAWPLAIRREDLRVRYCATGMDEARAEDTRLDGEPKLDRYLLQFWPAPPSADGVLKQTSATAAHKHEWASRLPPPPTPEEEAEAERRAELESQERMRRFEDELYWGGVRPSNRLRTLQANVIGLAELDRPLLDALTEADPDSQRAIARWAARRACDAAGLSSLDWVAPALTAIERGEELPAPFDDQAQVWERLFGKSAEFQAVVATTIEIPPRIDPQAAAVPSLFAAVEADPLKSAVDALYAAVVTFGHEYPRLLGELRGAFPSLR